MTTQITLTKPEAGTWTIDPAHTRVGFVARHLMASKVRGSFESFGGRIEIADDLGLFGLGPAAAPRTRGQVGLYHLAWQVPTIEDLETARTELAHRGALTGESSHGATKSVYGVDPDGNEFEIMWMLPRQAWGEHESKAVIERLDWDAELTQWAGVPTA